MSFHPVPCSLTSNQIGNPVTLQTPNNRHMIDKRPNGHGVMRTTKSLKMNQQRSVRSEGTFGLSSRQDYIRDDLTQHF